MSATTVRLAAADGHKFNAYVARPAGSPVGALVVAQEIFGVNRHMRRVTDGFAADGFLAVCPALFDRAEPGVELGYGKEDIAAGRDLRARVALDWVLADLTAAIAWARAASGVATGVIGYCWGGSLAWLAATRLTVDAAVGYYGGQVVEFGAETPRAPVMLHFGETDGGIPIDGVRAFAERTPSVPVHIYPAGHGFDCAERADYHPPSAALARARSLAFLRANLG
jgi:carboxymethylenebutenolidase